MKFLSILKAFKWKFPWWKRIFSLPSAAPSLGKKLQEAREEKKLSIDEVALKLHLPHSVIMVLEKEGSGNQQSFPLLDPGYARLIAVAYARLLKLPTSEIHPLLPPPAPLKSSTFIKKLSPLQQRPRKPHFMRKEQQLTYTLHDVKSFLLKTVKGIIAIVILFYLWNFFRHVARVIF